MAKKINIKLKGKKPSNIPYKGNHKDQFTTLLEVKLIEDLESPEEDEEGKITPTEAEAEVYRGYDEWGIHQIDGENEKVKIHNYNPDYSASEDDYLFVVRINGRWKPLSGSGGGMKIGVLKAGDVISARSGNTPGTGTVTLEKFSNDEIETTEKTVEVLNNFQSEINTKNEDDENDEGKDTYIQMTKMSGKYWVTAVDCADNDDDEEE